MKSDKEIPGYSEELRLTYGLTPDSIVIDAGGYKGDWAAEIHRRYGCVVHVLEPVKSYFDRIQARFSGIPRIQVHHFGIGAESCGAEFGIKNDSTGRFADSTDREQVVIRSVADILSELCDRDPDLVKLNIEGSEFDVVEKLLDSGLISRVRNLQVQWHPVAPNASERYPVIQERLAATHHLTFDSGWVWQSWRRDK